MFEYTQELATKIFEDIIEIKVDEDKDWAFDVVATTEDVDRDGEIIKIKGRDTKNWEKNPVILANHHYTIESIIGKGTKFYTANGIKRLKGYFSKTNPLGVLARNLYNEGMLKSVSVGFIVKERDPNDRLIITKAELLETSFVAVPCNPNAISLDQKTYDEAVEQGLITEVIEDIIEVVEPTTQELMTEIQELKQLVKSLVDDKTKKAESFEIKESVQEAKRILDDALRSLKLSSF